MSEPTEKLCDHSLEELAQMEATCKAIIDSNKKILNAVQEEYQRRFTEQLETMYQQQHKEHGTVKLALPDGWRVKGDVPRTVKYDTNKLMALAAKMPWDQVTSTFDIAFKVPEKNYKTIPPGEVKDAIDDAREVTYGKLKVTIERDE